LYSRVIYKKRRRDRGATTGDLLQHLLRDPDPEVRSSSVNIFGIGVDGRRIPNTTFL
jgi:hypothetical protein